MTEPEPEWDPPSVWDPPSSLVAEKENLPWNAQELPVTDGLSERTRFHLRRLAQMPALAHLCEQFCAETGLSLSADGPMINDRPSGVKRVGITVQWLVPSLGTRFAIGLETPLVHRVIDRITGLERTDAQHHLPTTPVEWGFWTVLAARLTDAMNSSNCIPRMLLDRVGADAFDFSGLGVCRTVSWELLHEDQPVGMVRAWVSDTLLKATQWPAVTGQGGGTLPESVQNMTDEIICRGRVQAGVIELAEGLGRLRPKLILPWPDAPISGRLPALDGPALCRLGDGEHRWTIAVRFLPESRGTTIEVLNKPRFTPVPSRKGSDMSADANTAAPVSPDLPVSLTIELGRLSLSLAKIADLKTGDVLSLSRNSREPVELTSGDRLVARGELVQMDDQLGVRILQILI